MSGGDRLAGCGALGDVNETRLLRVAQLGSLAPVVPDGGSNGILSEHCDGSKSATTWLNDNTVNVLEQWSLTGGRHNSFAISVFLIFSAASKDSPLTRSVIYELDAMALPHPNVLNLTSEMIPFSSTRICSFMTSPHLSPTERSQRAGTLKDT